MYEIAYKAVSNPAHTGTREKYLKAQHDFHENYVNSLLQAGGNVEIVDDSGKTIEHIETPNTKLIDQGIRRTFTVDARDRYRKIPYNPIELE